MNTRLISYIALAAFSLKMIPAKADVSEELQQELISNESQDALNVNALIADTGSDADESDDDYSEPQGSEVSENDDATKKAAKKQLWLNIGLAIAAVAVAITAMIIVSNNNGHHSH